VPQEGEASPAASPEKECGKNGIPGNGIPGNDIPGNDIPGEAERSGSDLDAESEKPRLQTK
jgi:hypothetical protein